ncbi:hypothetical protein V8E53_004455 [Lactarius tabidus]
MGFSPELVTWSRAFLVVRICSSSCHAHCTCARHSFLFTALLSTNTQRPLPAHSCSLHSDNLRKQVPVCALQIMPLLAATTMVHHSLAQLSFETWEMTDLPPSHRWV